MAKSVKCCLCDQPATVHLTQIINNKMLKVDLCEACASEKGLIGAQVPLGVSFEEVLKNHELHLIDAPKSKVKCGECGLDFRICKPMEDWAANIVLLYLNSPYLV